MQPFAQMSPAAIEAFNRFIKTLYFTLLASVGLYWVVAEMVAGQRDPQELGVVKTGLAAVAVTTAAGVLYLRFSRIPPLLADSSGALAGRLAHLRVSYILCFALAEAVALYGFVLRFLGASRTEAACFFAAAVILFALCYPRAPQMRGGPIQ